MVVTGFQRSDEVEERFVGRGKDFNLLEDNWTAHRLFGIFGIRAVGKSRFVNEFIRRYADKKHRNIHTNNPNTTENGNGNDSREKHGFGTRTLGVKVIYQELRLLAGQSSDISALYSGICASLGVSTYPGAFVSNAWIGHVIEELRHIKDNYDNVVLFFDNVEDVTEGQLHDDFMEFCMNIIRQCEFVKTIITSTTKIQLAQLRKVYFTLELRPLNVHDARELLKIATGSIELGEYEDEIVSRSEGLPLLILLIGSELAEQSMTPAEMVFLLREQRLRTLTKEFYQKEDRAAEVYWKFIQRLKPKLLEQLATLEYVPGSFSANHAREMLDFETTALVKNQVLIPIRRRFILAYDLYSRRFDIQGVLREVLKMYYDLPNLPEVRRRFCETFTAEMLRLSKLLGRDNYAEALAALVHEQPNLRKLMLDVEFTREDTYPFFIHIAGTCTTLIEQFMAVSSAECERFYSGCIKFANMYGRDLDKAVVYIAVGSMYTNVKGEISKGAENYQKALTILQHGGNTLNLATVYQRMGWNLHCQGRNNEAIGFFQKSLDISLTSGPEFQLLSLQSMNSLGVTNTVLGRFDEAEKYHFRSLERRKKINGERSPLVGATLNNIGVFYEQKEDYDKALEYYLAGYELKKGPKMPIITQVFSLNNIAALYSRNKQFDQAHIMLDEAMKLLQQSDNERTDAMALTYDTLGKVLRAQQHFEQAEGMFKKAVDIRKVKSPFSTACFESLVHLAQTRYRRGLHQSALRVATKAMTLRERIIECMPLNSNICECLQVIADVYDQLKDSVKYTETLELMESELLRLSCVCLRQFNEKKLQRINKELIDVRKRLETVSRLSSSSSTSELMPQASSTTELMSSSSTASETVPQASSTSESMTSSSSTSESVSQASSTSAPMPSSSATSESVSQASSTSAPMTSSSSTSESVSQASSTSASMPSSSSTS